MEPEITITLPANQLAYVMGWLFSSAMDCPCDPEETEEGQIYSAIKDQLTKEQLKTIHNHPNFDF